MTTRRRRGRDIRINKPAPKPVPALGVLLMTSHRDYLLDLIVRQVREEFPSSYIVLNADRPSAGVAKFALKMQGVYRVTVTEFGPVVCQDGEFFSQVRNQMLEVLRREAPECEYVMIWDDDQLWARPGEVRSHMKRGIKVIEAQDFFFWDNPHHVAVHGFLAHHHAPQVFANEDGDWFSEERIQHATEKVLESESKIHTNAPLLNYGLFTREERLRTFRVYKKAGKVDKFTLAFVAEPTLAEYKPRRKDDWVHRAAEHLKERGQCQ